MKNFSPFFVIGSLGMVVVALLHMLIAFLTVKPSHAAFFALYPVFLSFMIIGFGQVLKASKN